MFIPIEFQKAHEKTKQTCVRIAAAYTDKPARHQSLFGGKPFWPADVSLPVNERGELPALLAQINFADVPAHPELPEQGILQLFIPKNDDYYGANFDDPMNTELLVRFWENPEVPMADWTDEPTADDLVPVNGAHALSFNLSDDYAGIDTVECAEVMGANPFEILEDIALNEEEENRFFENITVFTRSEGHKLLGTPYFIDGDPREGSEYRLLLQIDTDMDDDNDIMWGDNGVGHFFIHREDLVNQQFDQLWFSWDACGD